MSPIPLQEESHVPCLPCSFTLEICQTVRLVRHGRLLKRSPSCRCTHAAFCQTPLLHNWREMKRASGFCVTRFLPCLLHLTHIHIDMFIPKVFFQRSEPSGRAANWYHRNSMLSLFRCISSINFWSIARLPLLL